MQVADWRVRKGPGPSCVVAHRHGRQRPVDRFQPSAGSPTVSMWQQPGIDLFGRLTLSFEAPGAGSSGDRDARNSRNSEREHVGRASPRRRQSPEVAQGRRRSHVPLTASTGRTAVPSALQCSAGEARIWTRKSRGGHSNEIVTTADRPVRWRHDPTPSRRTLGCGLH